MIDSEALPSKHPESRAEWCNDRRHCHRQLHQNTTFLKEAGTSHVWQIKITSFIRKLEMWLQRVKDGNVDSCEPEIIHWRQQTAEHSEIPCMKAHISATFPEIFPDAGSQRIWLAPWRLQCSTTRWLQHIRGFDVASDSTLWLQFQSKTGCILDWSGERLPTAWEPWPYFFLLPHPTYVRMWPQSRQNTDQSWTLKMNWKWQSQKLQPRFEKTCSMKQAHWKDVRIKKAVIFSQQTFRICFFFPFSGSESCFKTLFFLQRQFLKCIDGYVFYSGFYSCLTRVVFSAQANQFPVESFGVLTMTLTTLTELYHINSYTVGHYRTLHQSQEHAGFNFFRCI